ncbi:MAG TPA: TIGR02587 family membrane protein [Steroidobacter sp.]
MSIPGASLRIEDRQYAIGVARACGGALLFSLPILMTMEMWHLGLHMERVRLALLLILTFPLLVGLAYYLGFEDSTDLADAALDACVAFVVAASLATLVLYVFGVLRADMSVDDWIGKVGLQSLTGSIGALLAQSQFGRTQDDSRQRRRRKSDFAEYFFMAAGALFLSANVAPTEEVILIAYMTTPWHTIALVILSLVVMHAFVYALEFKGQHRRAEGVSFRREFMRFTLVGYLLALAISACLCWSFGRFDGLSPDLALRISVVLAFPTAVGAAAARLVL